MRAQEMCVNQQSNHAPVQRMAMPKIPAYRPGIAGNERQRDRVRSWHRRCLPMAALSRTHVCRDRAIAASAMGRSCRTDAGMIGGYHDVVASSCDRSARTTPAIHGCVATRRHAASGLTGARSRQQPKCLLCVAERDLKLRSALDSRSEFACSPRTKSDRPGWRSRLSRSAARIAARRRRPGRDRG